MKLSVNGDSREHRGDGTLAALLRELGADPDRVAVLVNGAVVPRDKRAETKLADGDTIEVLTFAGGG